MIRDADPLAGAINLEVSEILNGVEWALTLTRGIGLRAVVVQDIKLFLLYALGYEGIEGSRWTRDTEFLADWLDQSHEVMSNYYGSYRHMLDMEEGKTKSYLRFLLVQRMGVIEPELEDSVTFLKNYQMLNTGLDSMLNLFDEWGMPLAHVGAVPARGWFTWAVRSGSGEGGV